jgi:hypothetical protein
MRGISGQALIGALLLAATATAQAATPIQDGDTWGGQRHQLTRQQVVTQEGAAGVALTPSQESSNAAAVDRIYRQLMGPQRPAS